MRSTILRSDDQGPVVSKILFVGDDTFPGGQLVQYMATRESGLITLNRYRRRTLLEDLSNLERFYASQGFLTAQVGLDDISLSADSTRVELLIGVSEGDRWMVRRETFTGNSVLSDQELRELVQLGTGSPFMADRLSSDKQAILQAYARRSYLDASVEQDVERDDTDRSVSIAYAISEGKQAEISAIEVTGNEKTRGFVISRELGFKPGQLFDFKKIGESQARLYRTGLFNSVWIEPAPEDAGRAAKTVIVRVSERPSGAASFAAGYAAIDGAEVTAGINNRNVQGQATSLRLDGRYSELSRSARAAVGDPWFLGRRVAAEMSSNYEWDNEESYVAETAGAAFVLTKKLGLALVLEGGYQFQKTSVLRAVEDVGPGTNYTSALTSGVTYDTRNDVLNASRGMFAHIQTDFASSRLGGTNDFVRAAFDVRGYVSPGRGRVVSAQLRLGWLKPQGNSTDVPVNERFLTGGEGSVRGFPRNSLGPTDAGGVPIGGRALLVARLEFRVPLYKALRLAAFADAGQVYDELGGIRLSGIAVGAGGGLRYETRIGVIRVDVATPVSESGRTQYYFSIGQAF